MKPLLGYHLKPGSLAIDRGKTLETKNGPLDFFGSLVAGKAVNVGAVE